MKGDIFEKGNTGMVFSKYFNAIALRDAFLAPDEPIKVYSRYPSDAEIVQPPSSRIVAPTTTTTPTRNVVTAPVETVIAADTRNIVPVDEISTRRVYTEPVDNVIVSDVRKLPVDPIDVREIYVEPPNDFVQDYARPPADEIKVINQEPVDTNFLDQDVIIPPREIYIEPPVDEIIPIIPIDDSDTAFDETIRIDNPASWYEDNPNDTTGMIGDDGRNMELTDLTGTTGGLVDENYVETDTDMAENTEVPDEAEVVKETTGGGGLFGGGGVAFSSGEKVATGDGGYVQLPSGIKITGYVYPYLFLAITAAGGALGFLISKKYKQQTIAMLALIAAGLMGGSAVGMKVKPPVKVPS